MSFCIAELELPRGKREVAVVHRRWINGEQFYYPNFWNRKPVLMEALKSGWNPDEQTWLKYNGHIVGNRFYETYEKAELLLSKAENGSDFSSSEERGKKRKCSETSRFSSKPQTQAASFSESESDEELNVTTKASSQFALPPPPPLPSPNALSRKTVGSSAGPSLVALNYDDNTTALQAIVSTDREPIASGSQVMVESGGNSGPSSQLSNNSIGSPPSFTYTFTPFGSQDGISAANDHQRMDFNDQLMAIESPMTNKINLRGMSNAISNLQNGQLILTAKVDMVLDMLRTLVQSSTKPVATQQVDISLPLTTSEEFDSLNSKATDDKSFRDSLIDMLGVKGGNTSNQITYRVMSALMTNQLMTNFTMAGQKDGKRSFKDSIFLQCVCGAVRRNPKGYVATDKEIEGAVEYWLKKAKSRIEAGNKRANKSSSANAAADNSSDDV